jgi:acetyl-CoA acyltransferase
VPARKFRVHHRSHWLTPSSAGHGAIRPKGAIAPYGSYELPGQLRGEAGARQVDGARHAIAENGGGIYGIEEATCCITILGRG